MQVTTNSSYTPPTIQTYEWKTMPIGSPRQLLGFWKERTFDGPTEFSWGPGLLPPGKETAPPSEGMYRGQCPPVELTPSPDLSVQVRETRPKRGDPPRGYPGERVG